MPGLIEPHDHKDKYPMESVMELSAKQLLMAGITAAVDLGSGPRFRIPSKTSTHFSISRGTTGRNSMAMPTWFSSSKPAW